MIFSKSWNLFMGNFQMDNNKATLGGIIGAGVLVTSLMIGTEIPTYTTMLEPEYTPSLDSHEIVMENYPKSLKDISFFSLQYNGLKIGLDVDKDDYPEIEIINVPIVKKMVFQFKKPVKLDFS